MDPGLRVLIADDSAVVRDRLPRLLADVPGVEVVGQTADANATVAALTSLRPDVLILDLFMPGGGGISVLNRLRDLPARPVVIVFTNARYPEYREACARLGAEHFLDKSRDADRLVAIVRGLASAP
jgi:DNA-binding NarL/FixJ family response regulator